MIGSIAGASNNLMATRRPTSRVEFPGHVGAALLAYSPVAFVALGSGAPRLAVAGAATTVALASLPDVDLYVPGVAHRGHVHTVWFAVAVGATCAVAFAAGGDPPIALSTGGPDAAGSDALRLDVFGFVVGTAAICSHLAADALTPMGVAPFAPLRRRRISLGLTRSADRGANRRLLLLGLVTAVGAALCGTLAAPSIG